MALASRACASGCWRSGARSPWRPAKAASPSKPWCRPPRRSRCRVREFFPNLSGRFVDARCGSATKIEYSDPAGTTAEAEWAEQMGVRAVLLASVSAILVAEGGAAVAEDYTELPP